jgi:nitroimidazol reductase NimA-like FMN-containing flavoprotein (pyridoxamine 5'-phosphate oxidase superfamily)
LIEAADSCRLGLVDDSGPVPRPYIVALNHGYEPEGIDGLRGTFWFHGATEGYKLDLIRRCPQACVQLDVEHEPVAHALSCGWGMKYASLVATGSVRIETDPFARRKGLRLIMEHYLRLFGTPDGFDKNPMATMLRSNELVDKTLVDKTTVFRFDVETLDAKRKP